MGTGPQAVYLQDRRYKALNLRKMGLSYRAIAERMVSEYKDLDNYTFQMAYQDVKHVLHDIGEKTAHDAAELRTIELERYDQMLLKLMPKILQGDTKAIDTALRISKERRAMLGLDAPMEVKITEAVENELDSFLSSLQPFLTTDAYKQVLNAIVASNSSAAAASRN